MVSDSSTNAPLGSVVVSLIASGNCMAPRLDVRTSGDGRYAFSAVEAGTYTLELRRLGYRPASRSAVTVSPGSTTTLNVFMVATDLSLHRNGIATASHRHRTGIGSADRGTYRYSWYHFVRNGLDTTWQNGPQLAITMTEMNLLKSEELIRLNRAAEALPLINESRVANGELPPVTLEGPPNEPGCVPRKLNGSCGSLWDALVGGAGGEGSAPAPDPERCPVNLPRCSGMLRF